MSVFYTGRSPNTQTTTYKEGRVGTAIHRGLTLLWKDPRGKKLGKCFLTGAVAFVLSPCSMGSLQIPVLTGFLFSLNAGWTALLAAAMGCLGGTVFWQGDVLAELLAGAVAALLAVAVASGVKKKPWIKSLLCACVTFGLGLLFRFMQGVPGKQELLELGLRTGFALGAQIAFRYAGEKKSPLAVDGVLAFVAMGLGQLLVLRIVDLGFVLGAALACAGESLPMALFCGLGLDLAGITPVPMSAVLCLTAFGNKLLPRRRVSFLVPSMLALLWGIAAGSFDPVLPASLLLGGAVSVLLRPKAAPAKKEVHPQEVRLMAAATVLGQLAESLETEEKEWPGEEMLLAQITGSACGDCPRWQQCRETEMNRATLREAIPGLFEGQPVPESFLSQCCRPERFTQSVRQGVEGLRLRRQYLSRLEESRKALTRQYENLSRFLLELAMPPRSDAPCVYQAEVGYSTRGASGRGRSGDRVAWFSAPQNRFYVLLCDGMGTGRQAARTGQEALELLRGLLASGMDGQAALLTLNDHYVLTDTGGLSTADVLELRLDTGRAVLYKWGGAPSYWKHRRSVKIIGTAAPPPGLSVEGGPEVIRLSMQRGQMLVLVSDGLAGEDLPERIAGCSHETPQAMADSLTRGAGTVAEDDCTAVAVCLSRLQAGSL